MITLTVIVVAVAAGLYFLSNRENGNVPLKTYTNEAYGITFDYPESYALTETAATGAPGETGTIVTLTKKGLAVPKDGEGPTAITIGMYDGSVVQDTKEDPARAWITTSTSSNFAQSNQQSPGQTRVADKSGWLYTWDGLYQGTTVVTENNGTIYAFTVTYDGDADMKMREDFTEIMETVRFGSATTTRD